MKLCKDCRWVDWYMEGSRNNAGNAFCTHPTSVKPSRTNPVTGTVKPAEPLSCTQIRSSFHNEHCGASGLHWEAAPTEGTSHV